IQSSMGKSSIGTIIDCSQNCSCQNPQSSNSQPWDTFAELHIIIYCPYHYFPYPTAGLGGFAPTNTPKIKVHPAGLNSCRRQGGATVDEMGLNSTRLLGKPIAIRAEEASL